MVDILHTNIYFHRTMCILIQMTLPYIHVTRTSINMHRLCCWNYYAYSKDIGWVMISSTFSSDYIIQNDHRALSTSRRTSRVYAYNYNDVIMSEMASQITCVSIVYFISSSADQRKHQSSASLAGNQWITCTKASNAENVSVRWRHYEKHIYE